MSDAIDAAMLAGQRTGLQALFELFGSDPSTEQLPARHHSMRRARDPRELMLNRCAGFSPHQGGKSAQRTIRPGRFAYAGLTAPTDSIAAWRMRSILLPGSSVFNPYAAASDKAKTSPNPAGWPSVIWRRWTQTRWASTIVFSLPSAARTAAELDERLVRSIIGTTRPPPNGVCVRHSEPQRLRSAGR